MGSIDNILNLAAREVSKNLLEAHQKLVNEKPGKCKEAIENALEWHDAIRDALQEEPAK